MSDVFRILMEIDLENKKVRVVVTTGNKDVSSKVWKIQTLHGIGDSFYLYMTKEFVDKQIGEFDSHSFVSIFLQFVPGELKDVKAEEIK